MRYAYPCRPEPDEPEGSFSVTFRGLPGVITCGDSLGEALENAQEALELALTVILEDVEHIPEPREPEDGEETIALSPRFAAKMALLLHMRRAGVSPGELTLRTGMGPGEVRELLDPGISSPLEQCAAALQAIGRRILIEDLPEEDGEHLHQPATVGPIGEDEFIRRLRRYALHRNIHWVIPDDSPEGNVRVQVGNRVAQLPKGEIPALERSHLLGYLGIREAEF